jgi:hypothetical protein
MVIHLVNDHDCGQCGHILGAFSTPEKAQALVDRYREAYEADVWPDDLAYCSTVASIEIEEWELDAVLVPA